jgi:peptide-methionine (R)-S-oxide reductase
MQAIAKEAIVMVDRRVLSLAGIASALSLWLRSAPGSAEGSPVAFEVTKTEEEWRKLLTSAQFYVLREHGTEAAGSSPLDQEYGPGTYLCAGCALPLFSSTTKFHSGTGWPSFYAPLADAVATSVDRSFFMTRTEVHCRRCGGHLGHVFNDGPKPTGLRYCMNGAALTFRAEGGKTSS